MLLTLTLRADPDVPDATDLGFLLHKHPGRVQRFDLPVGRAHVFYPDATEKRCTVALLVEVDPIGLVRNRRFGADGFSLGQYVNDRPFAASSLLSVAIGRVFGSALHGRCDARPELAASPLPLEIAVTAVPTGGEPDLAERLLAPLGWDVEATPAMLDPEIPRWGLAPYVDLALRGRQVLADALRHLYVLLPVLDGAKHYWVGGDEVDKLLRTAGGWLAAHPERELITSRYLARQRPLVADATERLAALGDSVDEQADSGTQDGSGALAGSDALAGSGAQAGSDGLTTSGGWAQSHRQEDPADRPAPTVPPMGAVPPRMGAAPPPPAVAPTPAAPPPLAVVRRAAVLEALRRVGARRVVDLGCGEGALLTAMLGDPGFTEILGVDVSARQLARAERRLGPGRLSDHQRARISLLQSSVTYRDARLAGWDAIVLAEVIEHLDPERLPALARSVFGHARPRAVVVTTPNADYNVRYPGLAGALRHPDHRFEFSRTEFAAWTRRTAGEFGYTAELLPVGEADPDHGAPTQLALFSRATTATANTDGSA